MGTTSESIEYAGRIFRRYPSSKSQSRRDYFWARHGAEKGLHRAIWADANGPIPAGFVIHHVDGDTSNNSIENLSAVPGGAHAREHWRVERLADGGERKRCPCCGAEFVDGTRYRSRVFCGNACKSAHRRRAKLDHVERACARCAAPFWASKYEPTRYCSRRCSSAAHGERLRLQSDR